MNECPLEYSTDSTGHNPINKFVERKSFFPAHFSEQKRFWQGLIIHCRIISLLKHFRGNGWSPESWIYAHWEGINSGLFIIIAIITIITIITWELDLCTLRRLPLGVSGVESGVGWSDTRKSPCSLIWWSWWWRSRGSCWTCRRCWGWRWGSWWRSARSSEPSIIVVNILNIIIIRILSIRLPQWWNVNFLHR